MRRLRFRLSLGASLMLLGLTAVAFVHPVVADGEPTPLPDAISGPSVESLLALADARGLECSTFSGSSGTEWSCHREASKGVFYITSFPGSDPLVLQAFVSGPLPWPEDHDQFLIDFAASFCEASSAVNIPEFVMLARDAGALGLSIDDLACRLYSDYATDQIPVQGLYAWAKVDPAAVETLPPTLPPTPRPTLPPTAIPTAPPPLATPTTSPSSLASTPIPEPTLRPGDDGDSGSVIRPGGFVDSVPLPEQVTNEPLIIAQSLALAGLIVLLMPFPAQLFNSTLETHYTTVRRWFRLDALQRAGGRLGGFWDSLIGVLLFVVLSALIYALLDPSVGVDARGAATIAGLAIGIVLMTIMASAPSLAGALRSGEAWRIRALPATLLVGLICVLISRLTGFLPGYLYGVILGFVFARELSRVEQGRANGLAAAALLAMALAAWFLLALIGPDPSGIVATIVATTLSTLLVAGLEAVVFGLLPFRFLPGEALHATNRPFWAALLLIGAFCFFHILINPASGYLSTTARTPLLTIVGLFVAFALVSLAVWAYFRNKPAEA